VSPVALPGGRCLVLGVVNATPDSFSDGGRYLAADAAVARGVELAAQGADLVDVGGESTRPGAVRVSAEEEAHRVLPVVRGLRAADVAVSVDTMRAATARTAVAAGAVVVNDVSGGLADPAMAATVAELAAGAPDLLYVLSHWRGHSDVMTSLARYDDVVAEVAAELTARLDAVAAAGVPRERIVLDPGLGFAKVGEHDWALLHGLPQLAGLGQPLLVGASRKRFLRRLPADPDDTTAAVSALAAGAGAWGVRVHEVRASAAAVRVAAAWRGAGTPQGAGREVPA